MIGATRSLTGGFCLCSFPFSLPVLLQFSIPPALITMISRFVPPWTPPAFFIILLEHNAALGTEVMPRW